MRDRVTAQEIRDLVIDARQLVANRSIPTDPDYRAWIERKHDILVRLADELEVDGGVVDQELLWLDSGEHVR
jgi:hypothetical protein